MATLSQPPVICMARVALDRKDAVVAAVRSSIIRIAACVNKRKGGRQEERERKERREARTDERAQRGREVM